MIDNEGLSREDISNAYYFLGLLIGRFKQNYENTDFKNGDVPFVDITIKISKVPLNQLKFILEIMFVYRPNIWVTCFYKEEEDCYSLSYTEINIYYNKIDQGFKAIGDKGWLNLHQ